MEQRLQKVYRGVVLRFQNYFYLNFQVYDGSLDHGGDICMTIRGDDDDCAKQSFRVGTF